MKKEAEYHYRAEERTVGWTGICWKCCGIKISSIRNVIFQVHPSLWLCQQVEAIGIWSGLCNLVSHIFLLNCLISSKNQWDFLLSDKMLSKKHQFLRVLLRELSYQQSGLSERQNHAKEGWVVIFRYWWLILGRSVRLSGWNLSGVFGQFYSERSRSYCLLFLRAEVYVYPQGWAAHFFLDCDHADLHFPLQWCWFSGLLRNSVGLSLPRCLNFQASSQHLFQPWPLSCALSDLGDSYGRIHRGSPRLPSGRVELCLHETQTSAINQLVKIM